MRSPGGYRALSVLLFFALSLLPACSGCGDDSSHEPVAAGPDPCAPPPISGAGIARFADTIRFLYEGACPRQIGVDAQVVDPIKVGVVRGRVLDENGAPLAGVTITQPNEPRLGHTVTGADGYWQFVANGGGRVTLRFAAKDKLVAQRTVRLKRNRYAPIEDVALIPSSAKATHVVFGGAPQVAQGELMTDASGPRTATVFFPGGAHATVKKGDGSQAPLGEGTFRITEHTRGERGPNQMPSDLPPTSAYTYATSFTFDEVEPGAQVVFDKPAVGWVDNFLHMNVGVTVPAGAYALDQAAWSAEDSGRVVAVLPSGALDADGDGQPDSDDVLAAIGITKEELATLGTALKPGQSYMRVPFPHFSPWDLNWGFGPPGDALFGPDGSGDGDPSLPCLGSGGSTYECETRTLGEDIGIVGTGASLHYQSDRVPGRTAASMIVIPVTGPIVPASAKRAIVTVNVLGVVTTQTFPALTPGMTWTFTWDGKDVFGRTVPGGAIAEISVGLVYDGVYQDTQQFGSYAFSKGPQTITGDKARKELVLATAYEARLGVWDQSGLGFGGWSLSMQHVYDPMSGILYRGDGGKRVAADVGAISAQIAGGADFGSPDGIALGDDGAIYVADSLKNRIFKIAGGATTVVASDVNAPHQVAVRADGAVCFAEWGADLVRCIGKDGAVFPVLGGGTAQISATPIPALSAQLQKPSGLAAAPDGSLYVGEQGTGRVLRVAPNGKVDVAVSNLLTPEGLAVAPDGTLYIAEAGANRVAKVDPSGTVSTLVGTGTPGFGGDGGYVASAVVNGPKAVAVGPDGTIYVSDTGNGRIRAITHGRIQGFAGKRDRADANGSARGLAQIIAKGLAVTPEGQVLAADEVHTGVLAFRSPFPGVSAGEITLPSDDGGELYVFDGSGRHLRTLDALTLATRVTFQYDDRGLLTSVKDAHDNAITIARDAQGHALTITAPFGQATSLSYDPAGYLAKVEDPIGRADTLFYVPGGLLATRVDPAKGVHQMAYDPTGLLLHDETPAHATFDFAGVSGPPDQATSMTTGLGRKEAHAWTAGIGVDETRTVTAADGTQTTWTLGRDGSVHVAWPNGTTVDAVQEADPRLGTLVPYNAHHVVKLPSGATRSVDQTWTANVGPDSAVIALDGKQVSPDGTATSHYDGGSRTWTYTSPGGRTSSVVLDAEGRVASLLVPGLLPMDYAYDPRGRLAQVSRGDRIGRYAYADNGALARFTDPLGRVTSADYDLALRPTVTTEPDGAKTSLEWSAIDTVLTVAPPGKPGHAMLYGKDGLLTSYTAPGATSVTTAYDADRAVASITHEDGASTSVTRDAAGRPTNVTYAGGALGFTYDATGALASITGPGTAGLSFAYDGVLQKSVTATGGTHGAISFDFDKMFRVKAEHVTGGGVDVTYDYDADGLPMTVSAGLGSFFFTRDAATGLVTQSSVGLLVTKYTYTPHGEVASLEEKASGTTLLSSTFTMDALSRVTTKVENGVTWGYAYDAAGRLASVTKDGAAVAAYTYDANGNLTSNGATFDDQDRIVSKSGAAYTYTPRGERATKAEGPGTTSYAYDGRGYMTRVQTPSVTIDYELDAFGRRVARRRNGTITNRFLYRSALQPAAEVDDAGNVTTRYVYTGSLSGAPDALVRGTQTYALVKDEVGSVRFVIDITTSTPVQALTYDPYGNVLSDTNPGFQPFGFAGGLYDPDTRLVRFGEREYDPDTGAFVTKDPSGFSGGANVYAYAAGDPENFSDPTGANPLAILVGAAEGAIEGGAGEALDQAFDPNRTGYDCAAIGRAAAKGALFGALGRALGAVRGRGRATGGAARPQQKGGCVGGLCPRGNCFVAGTPVQTADGERPIDSLRAGDQVWSRDPETGELALHPVVRTYAREANDVFDLDIAEESSATSRVEHVRVTADHPWWTAERGWVETRALQHGQQLATRDGGRAWVFGQKKDTPQPESVFNVEVEGAHTYFVGRGALLVHNNCGPGSPGSPPTRVVGGVTVTPRGQPPMTGNVDAGPTLDRIQSGGAFPHRNDGSVFRNDQGLLPPQPIGYYKEWVHPTPGVTGPGPQRIVTGDGGEIYYTPDHYLTFIPLK